MNDRELDAWAEKCRKRDLEKYLEDWSSKNQPEYSKEEVEMAEYVVTSKYYEGYTDAITLLDFGGIETVKNLREEISWFEEEEKTKK